MRVLLIVVAIKLLGAAGPTGIAAWEGDTNKAAAKSRATGTQQSVKPAGDDLLTQRLAKEEL